MEFKAINRIQKEYQLLLKRYEPKVLSGNISLDEIKVLIEEVQLFWYKHNSTITYFLNNISLKDRVSYLAGAVRLDIMNDGHYEFGIMGNYRIINDPIAKMSTFYKPEASGLDYNYINQYFADTYVDTLCLLEKYSDDFWILPLELIYENEKREYFRETSKLALDILFNFFKKPLDSMETFLDRYQTYEEIEAELVDGAIEHLIYNDFKDSGLTLRERIEKHIKETGKMLLNMDMSEPEIFIMFTSQHLMQILNIVNVALQFKMCPFIRNDVVFSYFLLVYSNCSKEFEREVIYETLIGFVSQKMVDLTVFTYDEYKSYCMDRKLVKYVMDKLPIGDKDIFQVTMSEVLKLIELFISERKGNVQI